MTKIFTFSECLSLIMQKHQLTLTNLSTLIGSRADLKHVLSEDKSYAKSAKVFEKLKNCNVFDQSDYSQLAQALEISRLGIENYRFQRAISEILAGQSHHCIQTIRTDSGIAFSDRLSALNSAEKIEIICFNCCYHSLFSLLFDLFANKDLDISMKHYIQCDSATNTAAEYVSVVMPVLFDMRYSSYYRPSKIDSKLPSLGGNQLFIRAVVQNQIIEMYFVFVGDHRVYEMSDPASSHLFAFISKVLDGASPQPVAIKEALPYNFDFTSLCMTFLSHELNRGTYEIGCDLGFQQIPTDIALAAFRDKGFTSDEETHNIIRRTLSIHEQRYQNQYKKKKPTYRIMSISGCEHFLNTGEMGDHFIGFRPFSLEERKVIFANMLKAAHKNSNFTPLLLIDQKFSHRFNLVCYDKLGVSIDAKDTDYDISNGYRSVILLLPEFTKQYMEYYLDILVKERCHSRSHSLELLEEMYTNFLSRYDLEE